MKILLTTLLIIASLSANASSSFTSVVCDTDKDSLNPAVTSAENKVQAVINTYEANNKSVTVSAPSVAVNTDGKKTVCVTVKVEK